MKILFITDNFPPETNPPATRTMKHIKEWQKNKDVKITVITCFPNYPKGKIFEGYKNKLYQKEMIEKITVIRVWSFMAKNTGFLKRIIDHLSFAIMAFFIGIFQKFDIIVATSPQFFTTWTAFLLSKIKRKNWIFELRDIWPESIYTLGAIKNKYVISILEKIELALYKDAKVVIPVTHSFKNNLIKRNIDPKKITVITNGVDRNIYKPLNKNLKLQNELNLNGKFVVGYFGTHGLAHGLDFIIKSSKKINSDKIHFLFVGDGSEKNSLIRLADKYNISNISFVDSVSENKIIEYISLSDISLINLKKNDTFKSVIPSKMFNVASMQKPILLGVDGEARSILEKYSAGVFFEPENEKMFIKKLLDLKNNIDLYNHSIQGCNKMATDYDFKDLASKMLSIIKANTGNRT
jgi:glycosyltransferase involved in cell wall biosynthesis